MEAKDNKRKKQVAIICCDMSKAFDVADHAVLKEKLRYYGVDGPAHNIFADMICERAQVVVGDGGSVRSDSLTSSMGVAQGSAVSNILFSILLNDLPEATAGAEVFMYADDVAAVVTAASVDQLEEELSIVASNLARWFRMNGLALNLAKTCFIHFCLSGRVSRPITVTLNGEKLVQVLTTTFLGFELDKGLKWESHINKVCAKLGSACFALGRLARVVPPDVVRCCYFATVHSVLQYGAEIWGRAADWQRAFRMQKRAVRAIARISQDTSARPHFTRLGILTFPSIVVFQVAVYVRMNLASYGTAFDVTLMKDCLDSVNVTLKKSEKLTHVMGPSVYNMLPDSITGAPSLTSFKSRLKRWLIEQTFYDFEMLKVHKAYT